MKYQYSHHKILHENVCSFEAVEYSRFKFGDTFIAEKFADEVFIGFIEQYGNLILEKSEIVILPSPYHSIPTASNFLCSQFKKKLNQFLYQHEKNACVESKIHRNQTYTEDYGSMSFDERINLISNDTYHIDRNFIQGKFCIFLDDIKITGSHEKTIDRILNKFGVNGDFVFVYFAELCNKNINPNIENHYNYYAVKNISDLIKIINSSRFGFNTRIVKYLLKLDEVELLQVIHSISEFKTNELLQLAISNNYHQINEYKNNINFLNNKQWQSIYKKDNERASMLLSSPSV